MPIPLPNLDDRRWTDLVEQGRALIPLYSPEWTDHNASDPGITLLELFAFMAEMDLYRLNRIPDSHQRRFLALMGIRQAPPRPARGVVELRHTHPNPVSLPAGTEFSGTALDNRSVLFRSTAEVGIAAAQLVALQRRDPSGFTNVTAEWERQEAFCIFGDIPAPGAEIYLGLSAALPAGEWISLYWSFAGGRTGWDERMRLLEDTSGTALSAHHSARVEWEYLSSGGWHPLRQADDTRSLTLDGSVRLRLDGTMARRMVGKVSRSLFYVRCRLVAGAYDAPPRVQRLLPNAVELVQSVPLWQSWPIAKGVMVNGSATPGKRVRVEMQLTAGAISALTLGLAVPNEPAFTLLAFTPSTYSTSGALTLEAMLAGSGTAEPNQPIQIPRQPVVEDTVLLDSLEGLIWRTWERVDDFSASSRASAHFVLNPTSGEISCGDGETGRTFAGGALLFVTGETTAGAAGDARVSSLHDGPHNRTFVQDPDAATLTIGEQIAPAGGEDAEALPQAIGRAIQLREARLRAVTVDDFEAIALETPGTHLARATARPNLYPGLDCISAPGVVTVIVVPDLPGPRPIPSAGLLAAVAARLERRRTIGTRVVVVGPNYLEVAVEARVKCFPGVDPVRMRRQLAAAIDAFFHPLRGGPNGTGWPFGRDVYRSEVLQVIDETPGVDHVLSLNLRAESCEPSCGNLCLGPTFLVAAGRHEIEVMA